jgi:S-adenosylmethionine hydrolase
MKAVLARQAPGVPSIDLMADVPAWDVMGAAYLLPAFVGEFMPGDVFLCVVDPGVGSDRLPVMLEADGRWFVGPGNGLFELVARRAGGKPAWWRIAWTPERLSSSFHGRDLFAPIAARLARGERPEGTGWAEPLDGEAVRRADWPDDLPRVVLVDAYGNAVTGLRAGMVPDGVRFRVGKRNLDRAGTFSDVSPGTPFWYENSNGLVEFAVNGGRADRALGIEVGSEFALLVE